MKLIALFFGMVLSFGMAAAIMFTVIFMPDCMGGRPSYFHEFCKNSPLNVQR